MVMFFLRSHRIIVVHIRFVHFSIRQQTTTTAAAADGGGGSSSSDDPLKDTTVITLTVIAVVLVVGIATVLIITRPQPTTTSLGTSNVGVEMGPHSSRMPPSLSNAAYETSLNDGYFDVEEGYDV